tara:strand:+ start:12934 stop:13794 length:861 start_codon:yes stop_codon:yes gene_type:complete
MYKILHFSPVRKELEIVKQHLTSLGNLRKSNINLTLSFFDDNIDVRSSSYLKYFVENTEGALLHKFELMKSKNYIGEERWVPPLYQRITVIKNKVIEFFLNNDFDYLFLTDSDLIIQPLTLENLIEQRRDFCSSIFWTHFNNSFTYTPNAWFSKSKGFDIQDLINLKEKGIYAVDFTGACTLLSRKILEKNVSFSKIPNINYLGEDKHFCIRSAVMGFQPYVSTYYPAFHIYNSSYIKTGELLLQTNFNYNYLDNWLNEEWIKEIEIWLRPKNKSLLKRIITKLKQ